MAYRVRDFTGEAMAALQSLGGIGTALNERKRMDMLAKEGEMRMKESAQNQLLNQQKIDAGNRLAGRQAEQDKLIYGVESGGAMTPAEMEGTPTAGGTAIDFSALKAAKQSDADAKLWNSLHRDDPSFMPLSGGTFRRMKEAEALAANRADQAQIESKRQADIKEKSDATKLGLEEKDAATRRLNAESGRFSPVTLDGQRLGVLNTRTGKVEDSGEKTQPKLGGSNKQIIKPGETLIPNLEPIPGVEITQDSLKKTKDAYAAYQAFKNELDSYKKLVADQGSELAGEGADRASAMVTDLGMKLKALQDLGVLNGRDWELMMNQVPSTTGLGASLKGKVYAAVGQDAFGPRLDVLSNSMDDKFRVFSETNGFRKTSPGGAGPAPEVGATKTNSHGDPIRWTGRGWELAQ